MSHKKYEELRNRLMSKPDAKLMSARASNKLNNMFVDAVLQLWLDAEEKEEKEMPEDKDLDKLPFIRTPIRTYMFVSLGIVGIFAFTAAMLYIWALAVQSL